MAKTKKNQTESVEFAPEIDNVTSESVEFAPEIDNVTSDDFRVIEQLEQTEDTPEVPKLSKSKKMTLDEAEALRAELESKIGNLCQVVPFNSIEWVNGIIRGVVLDKRSLSVLYAIQLDDGRRIVKSHDAKFLQISDEKGHVKKASRFGTPSKKIELDDLMKLAEEYATKVGHFVEFTPTKELYQLNENGKVSLIEKLTGTIFGIVPEKRVGKLLIRIESDVEIFNRETETSQIVRLITHKTHTNPELVISDEFDADVKAKYLARQELKNNPIGLTPEDKFLKLIDQKEKLDKQAEKLAEKIAELTEKVAQAEIEYQIWLDAQENGEAPEAETETEAEELN